jgi:hypothetical protein
MSFGLAGLSLRELGKTSFVAPARNAAICVVVSLPSDGGLVDTPARGWVDTLLCDGLHPNATACTLREVSVAS